MRNLTYLIMALMIMSCSNEPINKSEASFFQADAKGKPTNLTVEQVQAMIDSSLVNYTVELSPEAFSPIDLSKGFIADFKNSNMELTNLFYVRRETIADDFLGIKFLEEISDRDYVARISGGGGFSEIFMDGNGGASANNIMLSTNGNGAFSQYLQTQNVMMFEQSNGVFNFSNMKTFGSNEEAKAFFVSKGWSRLNTLYRTPDGFLKVTY